MELFGAGLGDDLYAAVSDAVVLGGKRILIDANLKDGRLGRKLAARESIDVDLPAVRPGGRTGQLLEFSLELIGVVGEGIEVFASEDQAARVLIGIDADALNMGPRPSRSGGRRRWRGAGSAPSQWPGLRVIP